MPFPAMALGFGRNEVVHPILRIMEQTRDAIQSCLDDLHPYLRGGARVIPPVLPVEYIPLLDVGVYFGDRHRLKTEYHSRLVLKA